MKQLLTLVFSLCLAGMAGAQTGRTITLNEAIAQSLSTSQKLKGSTARNTIANLEVQKALNARLPDASISGSYLRLLKPDIDLKLKLGSGSSTQEGGGSKSPDVSSAMYGIASVSLPLYAGGRIEHGIAAAKFQREATKLNSDADREDVIAATIIAYTNLYKALKAVEVVKENERTAARRVADYSSQEQNGLLPRNDLLKAKLQQSNVSLTLLDAENNAKLAAYNVALLMGLPGETPLMPDSASLMAPADPGSFETWEATALAERKDLRALGYNYKAASEQVAATKANYYPQLALTGGYIAAHVPNVLTLTNALNGGIGLRYAPSTLWKNGSAVAQAEARKQELTAAQAQLADGIRLEVAQAWQAYVLSRQKIKVYAVASEQAEENHRIVSRKYENALATATDVLDADLALLQARLNAAFAAADATVAWFKLQQAAGVLKF